MIATLCTLGVACGDDETSPSTTSTGTSTGATGSGGDGSGGESAGGSGGSSTGGSGGASGGAGGRGGTGGAGGAGGTGGAGGVGGAAGGAGGAGGMGGGSTSCIVEMDAGSYHACALKQDGTVWCWGGGQSTPVQATAMGDVYVDLALGTFHACAVRADSTLWCWGANAGGQLGDGTTNPSMTPLQVTALGVGVVDVAAGGWSTCARKADDTMWCWGLNGAGQAGDGTTNSPKLTPVQATVVAALPSDIEQIAVGGEHVCARLQNGTLWCWGGNTNGELGIGNTDSPKLTPVQVAAVGNNVAHIAPTCARKQDGTLWCWGHNTSGQVGDGTTDSPKTSPVQVATLANGAAEPDRSFAKTCARKQDGTVWCWGRNDGGELGDGTIGGAMCPNGGCKPAPVQTAGIQGAVLLASGLGHACAALADETVWCWGQNNQGQLGDGTNTGQACNNNLICKPSPVQTLLTCP